MPTRPIKITTRKKYCRMLDPDMKGKSTGKVPRQVKTNFQTNIVSEPLIDEWRVKWESGIVTYGVTRKTNKSKEIENWENRALTIALRTWGLRIKDIKFRRIRKIDPVHPPDIILRFVPRDEDNLFKNNLNVLAYAYFPTTNPIGGDITFNDDLIWSKDGLPVSAHDYDPANYPNPDTKVKFRTYNLIHTLTHEVGHAIGLKHNDECSDCVMYPYYNGTVTLKEGDMEEDVPRIQAFYGARGLSRYWISYFHNRSIRRFNGVRPLV